MKMLRLALAGTALVGSFATAMANTCSFSGFYAGGQIGMGTMNSHLSGSGRYTNPTNGATGTFDVNQRLAATGVIGGLHVGYGKHFPNRFYLGVEGWGNLSNNKETNKAVINGTIANPDPAIAGINILSASAASFKAERKNSFGIGLRPGMVFGNTLVNLVLGVESTKFRYQAATGLAGSVTVAAAGESFPYTYLAGNDGRSKRRWGFVPGLEVSFHANERIVLGVRATHTLYRKKDGIKTQATDVVAKASYKF